MNHVYTRGRIALLVITLLYIGVSGVYFVYEGNHEFLWYIATMLVIVAFGVATIRKSDIPTWLLALLSFWGFLHMLGGGLKVGSGVLYAYVIIPLVENGDFTFLKYDQVIHFYGFALVAFVTYYLLRRSTTLTDKWLVPLCIFAAMGFGALNETLEFIGVLMIPETGVGGYYNTSLDLVANALGAATAAVIAPYIFKKHPPVDRQAQESA